jgi:hypothetical protein
MLVSWSAPSRSLYQFFITLFCCNLDYSCSNVLNYFKLHTLSVRRRYLEDLFLADVFNDSKYCTTLLDVGRNSSVRMENRYRLDGPGIEGQIFQTGPGAHLASCTVGTGSFPGVKRPESGVDHPPHLAPRLNKE